MLKKLNMIKDLNIGAWVNDSYVRQAFKDLGLDYDKQLAMTTGYDVTGTDPVCNVPVDKPARDPARSGSKAATSCRSARRPAR